MLAATSLQGLVTIETTPPATPSLPHFITADDTGENAFDKVTKVTQPSFSETVEANATVGVSVNESLAVTIP